MTAFLLHLLAVSTITVEPWLARFWAERARRRIREGDPLAKVKLYRTILAGQVISTIVVLGLCLFGGIPAARLGLGAPRSWWLSVGLAAGLCGLLVWNTVRLRPRAKAIREKLQGRVEALLIAITPQEQKWFGAVGVGAGISEKLWYRGFLFYYCSTYIPHINSLENVLLTSAVFGLAHLYQGWKGIVKTGVVGAIFAGFYLLSGNLLLPMIVHAAIDLQGLILFWGPQEGCTAAPVAA